MRITKENLNDIEVSEEIRQHLKWDLDDIREINLICKEELFYLDWQEFHNEYSCERTDPCPDYYGYFSIRRVSDNDLIGLECATEDELQTSICVLSDTCETLLKIN